jgi:hypothetical protein
MAQPIFGQNEYVSFTVEKRSPKIWSSLIFFSKNCPKKNSPIRLKFAQSGHPGTKG